ncbi:hypothetical protein PAMP_017869 [Pampus punctatissimus]
MKGLNITGLKGEKFFLLTMAGSDGRWKRRKAKEEEEEEEDEEGWGGIHSYSQSPTVQLQSHLLSLRTLFLDHSQGASQPLNIMFLWQDWACFVTPPAAPSSGDP